MKIHSPNARKKPWYFDNGCSKHMTGDEMRFLSFEKETGGSVTFGNNDKEHIIEKGMIGMHNYTKICLRVET